MAAIYEPSGAAREYSPLALNYIKGCDHGCVYCYVPNIMKRFNSGYVHSNVYINEESKLIKQIISSAKKFKNSPNQVFLSFLTDPYSDFNNETKLTRKVLEILLEYRIPVSILSKGGLNALQDMDLIKRFGDNIQVGASLTFTNEKDSLKWEKNASIPNERLEALKTFHDNGVKTWASMEPVIYPNQSLELMEMTKDFVDSYKIGKLNHFKNHEKKFDWTDFLNRTVSVMRNNNSKFYIKKDLLQWKSDDLYLFDHEMDMDHLALKNTFDKELVLF